MSPHHPEGGGPSPQEMGLEQPVQKEDKSLERLFSVIGEAANGEMRLQTLQKLSDEHEEMLPYIRHQQGKLERLARLAQFDQGNPDDTRVELQRWWNENDPRVILDAWEEGKPGLDGRSVVERIREWKKPIQERLNQAYQRIEHMEQRGRKGAWDTMKLRNQHGMLEYDVLRFPPFSSSDQYKDFENRVRDFEQSLKE